MLSAYSPLCLILVLSSPLHFPFLFLSLLLVYSLSFFLSFFLPLCFSIFLSFFLSFLLLFAANERTKHFAWSIMISFDIVQVLGSHQNVFTLKLIEGTYVRMQFSLCVSLSAQVFVFVFVHLMIL